MNGISKVLSRIKCLPVKALALALVAACFVSGTPLLAQEAPTLSGDLPDIAAYVPVVAAAFGSLIAAVLGVYFVIQMIKVGMSWIRRFTTAR